MDVKEAVWKAKDYIGELFAGEEITYVGLEEVVFDEESDNWKITIGFSRPWNNRNAFATRLGDLRTMRSYKVICISNASGDVESLTDRLLNDPK